MEIDAEVRLQKRIIILSEILVFYVTLSDILSSKSY